ncbi:3-isopropylmalate dehydrogenase [Lachnellula hyalina]|uniref:3-isopropylmalate dehydrogenase n=1 Tax=Lachnellula hyalina TaxID=1316788 RepID=A0A8H8QTE9_9HELO|nr:3-isopropylmalate dehydrogenase [Lachnellula hyalina]TVY22424.1 3-isopropylmalate dehydrogenase [Lachnellula hyalina]
MLRYSFGLVSEAEAIDRAVKKVLDGKNIGGLEIRTRDLGGTAGTVEMGKVVREVLHSILQRSSPGEAQ